MAKVLPSKISVPPTFQFHVLTTLTFPITFMDFYKNLAYRRPPWKHLRMSENNRLYGLKKHIVIIHIYTYNIYIYIHIYIYTYLSRNICIYIYIYVYIFMYIYIYTYVYTCIWVWGLMWLSYWYCMHVVLWRV